MVARIHRQTRQPTKSEEDRIQQLEEILQMVSTMVLRLEDQANIFKLDTSFVVFLRTDSPMSVVKALFHRAQAWKQMKSKEPEKLTLPMRAVLFQFLMDSCLTNFRNFLANPKLKDQIREMGWLTPAGDRVQSLQWNTETQKHDPNTALVPLPITEVMEYLEKLIKYAAMPQAINRFHVTRPMAEVYEGPTLVMVLDVGFRTHAAGEVWSILDKLVGSAIWHAGAFAIRHERLQRSALATRIAKALQDKSLTFA